MAERKLTFHNHTLYEGVVNTIPCKECRDSNYNFFRKHKELIERSLNHPSHCQHPLDFYWVVCGQAPTKCYFCDKRPSNRMFRHCPLCNITVCKYCLRDPPPLTIDFPKGHKHKLTLLARDVTFTCNACGTEGKRNPYVCFECSFMVHKDCIYLPRVININRHDHRISRASYLPHGNWECGVCRQKIDCAHGAFTCLRCPGYAVHSKCATRDDVWDGRELEDEPDEDEIEAPFEVINDTDIVHFSHEEHILRFGEDKANMRCDGCFFAINDDPFYKCVECNFCLHKTCANLPRKKRHFVHKHKLTLVVDEDDSFHCSACQQFSNGFRYECGETQACPRALFDIRCSSISEPFHHELHPHPLYHTSTDARICPGCNKTSNGVLSCITCDYVLGLECATLPRKVKHRCDDHFLSLCQGVQNSSGDLWCDICETKTDPSVWYYTCAECGITLHVNCVLGEFYYLKEGVFSEKWSRPLELLSNNGSSRPLCISCKFRCRFNISLKRTEEASVEYFCSGECYRRLYWE